jgi:predicted transcriptional regulator YheO
MTQQYKELFDYLGNQTGHGPNITLHQVAKLNDLNREIANNLSQPDWLYKIWPQC